MDYKSDGQCTGKIRSLLADFGGWCDQLTEPARTRDHTSSPSKFAPPSKKDGARSNPQPRRRKWQRQANRQMLAFPRLSSAVFFIAAASLFPDSNVLHPQRWPESYAYRDSGFVRFDGRLNPILGPKVAHEKSSAILREGATLKGGVCGERIPLLIDELPMLAALGPYTTRN